MKIEKTIEKMGYKFETEADLFKFVKDQWGMICSWLREHEGEVDGYFKITSVAREDLEGIGYDTSKVNDETMRQLASKMADDYCDNGFWIDLPILADALGIPKQK